MIESPLPLLFIIPIALVTLVNGQTAMPSQGYQIQTYVVSQNVLAGHQIPPVAKFSESQSYVIGLTLFPIIIAALGLLSVLIFQSILCVRFCFHSLCPDSYRECYNIASASEPDYERRKAFHWRSICWFFTFITLTLVTNCFVFLGDSYLSTSGKQASNSIVQMSNLFSDIKSNANSLSYDLGNISSLLAVPDCYVYWNSVPGLYNQLVEECQAGESSAQSLSSQVGSTGTNLNDLNNVLTNQGLYYKNISVYVLFAIVTLAALLLVLAYFVKLKWLLTTAIVLSLLMVALMTIVGSALMFATVSIITILFGYLIHIIRI